MAMSIIEYDRICIRISSRGLAGEVHCAQARWKVACVMQQLQPMLLPTLVLLLPDLNGCNKPIMFISPTHESRTNCNQNSATAGTVIIIAKFASQVQQQLMAKLPLSQLAWQTQPRESCITNGSCMLYAYRVWKLSKEFLEPLWNTRVWRVSHSIATNWFECN